MPIRVNCQCGQVLQVPDAMAGKAGKCPKCSAIVRVPAARGATSGAANPTSSGGAAKVSSKPHAATAASTVAKPSRLDALFEEAGLEKQVGNTCPKCGELISPGAVLCVKCGLNFQTGQVLAAYEVDPEERGFGNIHLDEAVQMLKRDDATEKKIRSASMPWWVLLSIVFGVIMIAGAGVLIVDAQLNNKLPQNNPLRPIQDMPVQKIITGVGIIVFGIMGFFAQLNIIILAFMEKLKYGLLCLFIPLYLVVYALMRYRSFRGAVNGLILSVIGGVGCTIGYFTL